jgi:chromatin licensing and DNA replication factor 1
MAQITPGVLPEAASAVPPPSLAEQQPVGMSHMSHSFKRRFSQRSSTSLAAASTTSPLANAVSAASSPLSRKSVLSSLSGGTDHESQVQEKCGKDVALRFGASEGTPAKFASTPVRLMAATPGLDTPKRPTSGTACDTLPPQTAKRSARAKLFMTPTKNASNMEEEKQSTSTSAIGGNDELLSFLPKSLLQSVSFCCL